MLTNYTPTSTVSLRIAVQSRQADWHRSDRRDFRWKMRTVGAGKKEDRRGERGERETEGGITILQSSSLVEQRSHHGDSSDDSCHNRATTNCLVTAAVTFYSETMRVAEKRNSWSDLRSPCLNSPSPGRYGVLGAGPISFFVRIFCRDVGGCRCELKVVVYLAYNNSIVCEDLISNGIYFMQKICQIKYDSELL